MTDPQKATTADAEALQSIEYVCAEIMACERDQVSAGLHALGHWRRTLENVLIELRRATPQPADARASAVAEPDALLVNLADAVEEAREDGGFWRSCSGCYETEDGHPPMAMQYGRSAILDCALGLGCHECGGLGAVWDDGKFYAMIEADNAPHPIVRSDEDVPLAPLGVKLCPACLQEHTRSETTTEQRSAQEAMLVGEIRRNKFGAAYVAWTWHGKTVDDFVGCSLYTAPPERASGASGVTEAMRVAAYAAFLEAWPHRSPDPSTLGGARDRERLNAAFEAAERARSGDPK